MRAASLQHVLQTNSIHCPAAERQAIKWRALPTGHCATGGNNVNRGRRERLILRKCAHANVKARSLPAREMGASDALDLNGVTSCSYTFLQQWRRFLASLHSLATVQRTRVLHIREYRRWP